MCCSAAMAVQPSDFAQVISTPFVMIRTPGVVVVVIGQAVPGLGQVTAHSGHELGG